MSTPPVETLFEEVIAAHGGRERWRSLEAIELALDCGGLAFASHLQPTALRHLRPRVHPHARRIEFRHFCRIGWRGVWTPDRVQILDDNDRLVGDRPDPRASFARVVKQFRWDKLDILYFAGYALWNYLSFPFLLDQAGVTLAALGPVAGERRLAAVFDAGIPTHSTRQVFHLDESRRLVRHDYTADVIGGWARAANRCLASEVVGGLRFYTRRKVYPRLGRLVLTVPTLVWIKLDDIRLSFSAGASASGP